MSHSRTGSLRDNYSTTNTTNNINNNNNPINTNAASPSPAPGRKHQRYGTGETGSDVTGLLRKYKLVILGEQSSKSGFVRIEIINQNLAGKTSLITRFVYDSFDSAYQTTIGIDFLSKTMYLDDRTIRLQLWDTAGQERFRTLIPSYIRDSAVTIVVYDVTSRQSFEAVERWVEDVHRERGEDVLIALVGNKSDLSVNREVSPAEGEAKARSLSAAIFLETSAKTGANVKTLFVEIAQALGRLDTGADEGASVKANLIDVKLQPSQSVHGNKQASSCSC